ncbi:hypothetical protein ABWI00_18085 [Algihabitans albus]|uniref:hypothetical protein n=1 Tax=Algihabitans albus TaxID=2164067 RepID=UPI0035D0C45C
MSACSTDARRPAYRAAVALFVGLLASGPVLAQGNQPGAPRSLLPPPAGSGPTAATGSGDARGSAGEGRVAEDRLLEDRAIEARPRTPSGMQVETLPPAQVDTSPRSREGLFVDALEPIDPATVGVLTERDPGGFGGDIWAGLERNQVATLLQSLPVDLASPTLRGLLRRLLLTSAAAPEGRRQPTDAPSLLGLRAERLFALGDTTALIRLLDIAPEGTGDELLDRTRVQVRLITGREQEACRLSRQGVADYGGAWWSKTLIFCQLAAGEEDAALLGLDLLREEDAGQADPDFLQLANASMGFGLAPTRPAPTALNLAMLSKLQARPDAEILQAAPLGRSEQLLGLQALPGDARVALAERAAAAGALPGVRLADFYDVFSFGEPALTGAIAADLDPADLRDRALLFRAMESLPAPPERAELLSRYLSGTRDAGVALAGLRAAVPAAVELEPAPALARWAAAPGRTLFYDGRLEQALAWFENAGQAAEQWPEAAGARWVLWPYARLAGTPAAGWTSLQAWAGDADAAGLDRQTVALLAAALFGLGENDAISAAGLDEATFGPRPDSARLAALRAAGQASHLGETLLRAAAIAGDDAVGELHPLALAAIVEALVLLDLTVEARQFAMEALASRGL